MRRTRSPSTWMIRARSGTEIPAGSTRYRNDGILSRAMRSMGALAGATLTSGRATWTPFVDPTVLPRIGTSRARGRIGPALLAEPISAKLAAVRVAPHWPQRAQPQPTPAPPGGLDETDGFDQGGPSVAGPAPVQHVALDGRDLRTRLADHETDVAGLPIGATCLSRPDRSTSLKATHWTLPACQPTSQRRNRLHPRSPPDGTPGVQPRADRCVGRCMHALELVEKPSHHQLAPTSSPNRARDGPARPRSWSAPLSSPDRRLPPAPRPSGSRAGHRDRPLRRRPGRGRLNVGSPRSGGASPVAPALRRPGGRVRCGPRGRVRPLGAHRSQHQRPGMAVKERPVRGAR
jgi:hypothetical protein